MDVEIHKENSSLKSRNLEDVIQTAMVEEWKFEASLAVGVGQEGNVNRTW